MKRNRAYISGQITGLSEKDCGYNFSNAVMWAFREFGCKSIVNPLRIKPFLGFKTWICYMINDIRELRKCQTIVMQPNWIESRGAVIEYFLAKFVFKMKIVFMPKEPTKN